VSEMMQRSIPEEVIDAISDLEIAEKDLLKGINLNIMLAY
jgi:hypothetical protein